MTALLAVIVTLIAAVAIVPVAFGVAFTLIPLFIACTVCMALMALMGVTP